MYKDKKLVLKCYNVYGNDLSKDYTGIELGDLHLSLGLNTNMIKNINCYLKEESEKINFVFMVGDSSSYKYYLDNDKFDFLKKTLNNFSESADAPLYVCLGNHDFGIFTDENKKSVRKKFRSLGENSNIIPLDNKSINYNDEICITGITPNSDIYKSNTYQGENGVILNKTLKRFTRLKSKYNIALIHDPLATYYATKNNPEYIEKFNLVLSGHEHGGYLTQKQMEKNNDGYGYVEYFRNFKPYLKIPCCYGKYKLTHSTDMIITEGIRRYNGYIPGFIYTTPFVTEVSINPKKKIRK